MTHPLAVAERTIKNAPSTTITGVNGLHLEPRCRVCRKDQMRTKVNGLLASGASYAMIARSLRDDNAKLDARDRVTIDSIRNHTVRHFPVQQTARATYREILERRAKENGADFIEGVATAITPMAYYETVMVKAYQTLVDEDTVVSVEQGAYAAKQLHELSRLDAGVEKMAEMHVQMNRIVKVMREIVPARYHQAILDVLEGKEPAPMREIEDADEVEEFDPGDDEGFDEED